MELAEAIIAKGIGVLPAQFSAEEITRMRECVLAHLHLMSQTRATPSARHLAGFHRYPQLEPLHLMLTQRAGIRSLMSRLCGDRVRTIGLSDITVNRSQDWHKDLLRGEFAGDLARHMDWSVTGHGLFKVLLYLQDSDSLQYVVRSHTHEIPLHSDRYAVPGEGADIRQVPVRAGDVAVIDLRLTHRGSPEAVFATPEAVQHPKILISTVFGSPQCPYIDIMETGNARRQVAWSARNPATNHHALS